MARDGTDSVDNQPAAAHLFHFTPLNLSDRFGLKGTYFMVGLPVNGFVDGRCHGSNTRLAAQDVVGGSPVWDDRNGRLMWVDIIGRHIQALDPATLEHQRWTLDGRPTSIGLRAVGGAILGMEQHLSAGDGHAKPVLRKALQAPGPRPRGFCARSEAIPRNHSPDADFRAMLIVLTRTEARWTAAALPLVPWAWPPSSPPRCLPSPSLSIPVRT
ncbi:MAG: SMP-30/gluconolactonase/LRE family protein [Pseudomonadota bacterium]